MLISIVEFFRNLPAKTCAGCGKEIEELHECYVDLCHQCMGITERD